MKYKCLALILALLLVALCGCTDSNLGESKETTSAEIDSSSVETSAISSPVDSDMFSDKDTEVGYDESESFRIILSGDTAACEASSVKIDGNNRITITDEGTYIVSGTLNDGMLIVDAGDSAKLKIVLDNVSISNNTSAAFYIKTADKVFVTLAENSVNSFICGDSFVPIDDSNIDGAVFSKQDLTFNGNGSLEVSSPAGHGIVCKDDLVFTSGDYSVSSASHGIDANDSFRFAAATINITAGKDGIHVENSDNAEKGFIYYQSGVCNITAEGDGISAGNNIELCSGEINITAGGGYVNGTSVSSENYGGFMGGRSPEFDQYVSDESEDSESMKGLKSAKDIAIDGCKLSVDSADDSIHSDASIVINSGDLSLYSGDDAIHAEETLTINDGMINIYESYEGLEALDIIVNGGDISLASSDDGINAAGGTDESGFGGRDNGGFGGRGGMGGPGGFGGSGNSDGSIVINDGNLYIKASGDGIDANGYLEINGGYTVVCGPTQGDTAVLDYDTTAEITGGTFLGTGSSMMAQTFTSNENQGVLAISVGQQYAETDVIITDLHDKEILKYVPELSFEILIYSSSEIKTGETYNVIVGENSGEITAD